MCAATGRQLPDFSTGLYHGSNRSLTCSVQLHRGSSDDYGRRVLHPFLECGECDLYDRFTKVGPLRETSVVVEPTVTTTYKLYATNQYGRTIRTVTVTMY
jgi:hypothetical protein